MPKFTRGKSIWPAPVYEGRFADGTVQRMSFYSLAGKPIDFDRGRHGVCLRGLEPGNNPSRPQMIATDIVCGHVEIGDETFADPYFSNVQPMVRARRAVSSPSIKRIVSAIGNLGWDEIEAIQAALDARLAA